jgi:leucyl aminopeptidase
MEFTIKSGSPEKQRSACVVVGVFDNRKLSLSAELIDRASNGYISEIIRRGDMEGKLGATLLLHSVRGTLADRVLLLGLGKERDFRDKEFRQAIRSAVKLLNETGSYEAVLYLTEEKVKRREVAWRVEHAVIVAMDSVYRFEQMKSEPTEVRRPLRKLTLSVPQRSDLGAGEAAAARGLAISHGMDFTKDLGNLPGNVCTPRYLAERAQELGKAFPAIKVTVLERAEIEALGMGSFLSVTNGSDEPPRFIVLEYEQSQRKQKPIVLVGKGITFDTGGLQIKPVDGMVGMKTDMSGSAIVLAVLAACRELEVPVRVTGLLALAENAVGGASYRPGDVLTQFGGRTVEIGNTDAEGRIVMADALAYADAHLDPAYLVDVATLTGAARIALGRVAAPVFGTDAGLCDALVAAGATTGETLWPMPLPDTYRRALDSDVADLTHIADGVGGGAVTAALFLREFVGERRWAHLDIAGTGRSDVDAGISAKGATGFGTRLLLRWLEELG